MRQYKITRYLPTAITTAIILYLTLFPDPVPTGGIPIIPGIDKFVHAIMFGGFVSAILFDYYRANTPYRRLTKKKLAIFTLSGCMFGGIIEIIQQLMDIGRSGDWLDFIADCTGCIIAAMTAPPVIKRIFQK
jgi:VanZ family protein